MTTRHFGGKDDKQFWCDKPLQKGHPNFIINLKISKFVRWCKKHLHIHLYNKPYVPLHKSADGLCSERMNVVSYKCRCGKCK